MIRDRFNEDRDAGSSKKGPTIRESEHPINKSEIGDTILNLIYEKLADHAALLRTSDFEVEFICSGYSLALIKIHIKSSKNNLELKLEGEDAKRFVELLDSTKIWQN